MARHSWDVRSTDARAMVVVRQKTEGTNTTANNWDVKMKLRNSVPVGRSEHLELESEEFVDPSVACRAVRDRKVATDTMLF